MPHLTIDLREEFRAGVVEPLAGRPRGGPDARTRACAATATCASTRCSSWPTRLGARDARHRPLRARRTTRRPLLRVAADPRQGPELRARGARARVAGAAALPARRADEARGARARRAGGPGGRAPARLAGPVLPGGHGPGGVPRAPRRPGERPGGSSTATAACSGATAATTLHGRPAPRPRHRRRAEPLYVLATDARRNTCHGRPARGAARRRRSRCATRRCTATGGASTRQAALPVGARAGGRRGDPARGTPRAPSPAPA